MSTIAANRFAANPQFTPSVLEYPLCTWQYRVVVSNGSSANRFAAKTLTCTVLVGMPSAGGRARMNRRGAANVESHMKCRHVSILV